MEEWFKGVDDICFGTQPGWFYTECREICLLLVVGFNPIKLLEEEVASLFRAQTGPIR